MSQVTRCEKAETAYMEPFLSGDADLRFEESQYVGYRWRCDGCGLVWEKRWHAEACEERGHKSRFTQEYHSGPPNYRGERRVTIYVREAVRRESVTPSRSIKARRGSTCTRCGQPIAAGEDITPVGQGAPWVHLTCPLPAVEPSLQQAVSQ